MDTGESREACEGDSLHMKLLEKALSKTTGRCLASFSASLLKEHFQLIHNKGSDTFLHSYKDVVTELGAKIEGELALMFEEEGIGDKMARLDGLRKQSEESSGTTAIWRPSGCPRVDLCAQVQSTHQKHLQQLHKVLDQLETQNHKLHQSVRKHQEKVAAAQQAIAHHQHRWQQVNSIEEQVWKQLESFVVSHDMQCGKG